MTPEPALTPNINIGGLITGLIGVVIVIAFIASFANLLLGGLQWIVTGGDKEKVARARGRIIHSFVGLIIVVAAFPVFQLVQTAFGITVIGADLGDFLQTLFPQ